MILVKLWCELKWYVESDTYVLYTIYRAREDLCEIYHAPDGIRHRVSIAG